MRGITTTILLTVALAVAWAGEEATQNETKSEKQQQKEREETTEKNSRQIYSYNRGSGFDTTFPNVYPNNVIPSNNPTVYNPSYNPSLYPNNYYPTTINSGGVYPLNPTLGNGYTDAFTVRRASPRTTAGSRVFLTQAVTQGGSGWNAGSSEFVATSPGMFFFTFSAVSDRYSHFRISLRHNGIEVVSAYGDASGYQMGSQSAILNLRSGDRVYLQLDEGRLYDSSSSSRGYTTFSGFRMQ
ncbi:collagen alpha-1(VIII) chain-like [Portunus trituberculatus]|uniref:collagen alpha-1(VIII) chain-like n=1 Tax=Portunus trituberculatus TaxID=210409 RepID=UPI001E1CE992|nr:collagen alpha-1(VIII) chain-like [Portunus trituberculatus]